MHPIFLIQEGTWFCIYACRHTQTCETVFQIQESKRLQTLRIRTFLNHKPELVGFRNSTGLCTLPTGTEFCLCGLTSRPRPLAEAPAITKVWPKLRRDSCALTGTSHWGRPRFEALLRAASQNASPSDRKLLTIRRVNMHAWATFRGNCCLDAPEHLGFLGFRLLTRPQGLEGQGLVGWQETGPGQPFLSGSEGEGKRGELGDKTAEGKRKSLF